MVWNQALGQPGVFSCNSWLKGYNGVAPRFVAVFNKKRYEDFLEYEKAFRSESLAIISLMEVIAEHLSLSTIPCNESYNIKNLFDIATELCYQVSKKHEWDNPEEKEEEDFVTYLNKDKLRSVIADSLKEQLQLYFFTNHETLS